MTNLIRRNQDSRGIAPNGTNPPSHILDAFRMMDALLGWDPLREGTRITHQSTFSPTFDVEELKDAYVLRADLPGLTESDVDVTVTGNALTVSASVRPNKTARASAITPSSVATGRSLGPSACPTAQISMI